METLRGQLLIAQPTLLDPNFHRTVVLICSHDEEGALGVVLNQPADRTVAELAPELAELVADDEPLFVGGPVAPEQVVILAEWRDPADAGLLVDHTLGFVGGDTGMPELVELTSRARVFAGHAGWGPGQLEAELEQDSWFTEPFLHGDVFTGDPESLWSNVLRRKGGSFQLVARMPENPSLN